MLHEIQHNFLSRGVQAEKKTTTITTYLGLPLHPIPANYASQPASLSRSHRHASPNASHLGHPELPLVAQTLFPFEIPTTTSSPSLATHAPQILSRPKPALALSLQFPAPSSALFPGLPTSIPPILPPAHAAFPPRVAQPRQSLRVAPASASAAPFLAARLCPYPGHLTSTTPRFLWAADFFQRSAKCAHPEGGPARNKPHGPVPAPPAPSLQLTSSLFLLPPPPALPCPSPPLPAPRRYRLQIQPVQSQYALLSTVANRHAPCFWRSDGLRVAILA